MKLIILLIVGVFLAYDVRGDFSVEQAEQALERAEKAIAEAEQLLLTIPEDSEEFTFILEIIEQANEDWQVALVAFEELKSAQVEIDTTESESLVQAFEQIAQVNAQVASVHADSVLVSLSCIKLIAQDKPNALEQVKESIATVESIKELVIENQDAVNESIIATFSDTDMDGYTDAVEISEGSDPNDPDIIPEDVDEDGYTDLQEQAADTPIDDGNEFPEIEKSQVANSSSYAALNAAAANVAAVANTLTELTVEMVVTLTEIETDDVSIVQDDIVAIETVEAIQVGVVDRFEELSESVETELVTDNTDAVQEQQEIAVFIDVAAAVSETISNEEEIDITDAFEEAFEDIGLTVEEAEEFSEVMEESIVIPDTVIPDTVIDSDIVPDTIVDEVPDVEVEIPEININEDISQPGGFQDVMDDIQDAFQEASGNETGFDEADATQI